MLEAGFIPGDLDAFKKEAGKTKLYFGGGGGGGAPTQSTSYQTNVPEYAKPYVTNMMEATQKQLFKGTPTENGGFDITGFKPYQPYSTNVNDYVAGFSPMQQQAQRTVANMQMPGAYNAAAGLTGQAALGSLNASDQAAGLQRAALGYGQAGAEYGGLGADVGLQGAQQAQGIAGDAGLQAALYGGLGAQQGMQGSQLAQRAAQQTGRQAGMYGAMGAGYGAMGAGLAPQAQAYGQNAADIGMGGLGYGAQGANAAQRAARQSSMYGGLGSQAGQEYAGQSAGYGSAGAQYGSAGAQTGQNLGEQLRDTGTLQSYMNPYLQASLQPQLAEMERQYGISGAQQQSGATKAGAFGGSREALMAAENQRNKNMAMNQAIGQGYNTAFTNAQQQLQNANQAALAGTAQGMQGAGIGLQGIGQAGSQAMQGYGMGLQGANQAGQFGLQGAQSGLAGLGTAMQGQQAGLAGLQGASQLYGQGMQGAQAGLAGVNAQQAASQLGLAGTAQGMQGAGAGLSGVGQQLAAGQFGLQGTQAGMQGAQAGMQGAQAGLQGVQGAIGGGQYGLQGLGQVGAMGSQLANIGGQQLAAQQSIAGAQNQYGAQQQALEQQKINQAIQDYATQQQYPLMQLGFMSNMLRGLPLQATTTQTYQAQPSAVQQGIGALGTYAGAARAGLFKEGGAVKGLASGGTIRYADTGVVQSNPSSGVTRGIQAKLAMMPVDQLKQIAASSPSEEIRTMANELIAQKQIQQQAESKAAQAAPQPSQGIAAAPAPGLETMADGGIIAFANRGTVKKKDSTELTANDYDDQAFGERLPTDEPQPAPEIVAGLTPTKPAVPESLTKTGPRAKQDILEEQRGLLADAGVIGKPMTTEEKYAKELRERLPQLEDQNKGYAMMDFFSRFGSTPGGLRAVNQAAREILPEAIKRNEGIQAKRKEIAGVESAVESGRRKEDMDLATRAGITGEAERAEFFRQLNDVRKDEAALQKSKEIQELANKGHIAAALAAAKNTVTYQAFEANLAALVEKTKGNPNDPMLRQKALNMAIASMHPRAAGAAASSTGVAAEKLNINRVTNFNKAMRDMRRDYSGRLLTATDEEKAQIKADMAADEADLREQFRVPASAGGGNASTRASGTNIEEAVKAAGQTYEPNKYDYRIVNGSVQRKAKS